MKRKIALVLILALLCPVLAGSALGASATPTQSAVTIDGQAVQFDAYNIGGNNYIKLRDLACALSGTAAQFDVDWDGRNILLASNKAYTVIGGEMAPKGTGSQNALPSNMAVIKDGVRIPLCAYNIGGNNYFKLRDLAQIFDFSVDFVDGRVVVDTTRPYVMPQGTVLAFNSYPLLLVGMTKAQIDEKLGAPVLIDEVSGVRYENGYRLGFDVDIQGDVPTEENRCYYVSGLLEHIVSACPKTLTLAQARELFGSGDVRYSEMSDSYYLVVNYGGVPLSIECDRNGTATFKSMFFFNANNVYTDPQADLSWALGRWRYSDLEKIDPDDEFPTGTEVVVDIREATESKLVLKGELTSYYGTSFTAASLFETALTSTDGKTFTASGVRDSWDNILTLTVTLENGRVTVESAVTRYDGMARCAFAGAFTLE